MIIFNNTSADFVLISADVLLKIISILKELRIAQLCSKTEQTLVKGFRNTFEIGRYFGKNISLKNQNYISGFRLVIRYQKVPFDVHFSRFLFQNSSSHVEFPFLSFDKSENKIYFLKIVNFYVTLRSFKKYLGWL